MAVGYFNGANDVSKAIATLVGSGVSRYRTAVIWGSLWTFAGAATAALASQGLVAAFSGRGILHAPPAGDGLLLAVAAGALAWIWFATKTGLPVSTTHALTGALVGAGATASGWSDINGSFLITKFALPLAVGPLLAMAIIFLVYPVVRRGLTRWQGYCVCVQQPAVAANSNSSLLVATAPAEMVLGETEECESAPVTIAGVTVADGLHWLSAGATAFARGLNDAPKVLGLGLVALNGLSLPLPLAFLGVALAMTAGSLFRGLKVTETLAEKVTKMEPLEGLAANLVTAGLVIFASHLALPVSTTHVSSGAIIGLGLKRDAGGIQWKTVREMILAWVVTLPAAALVASMVIILLRSLS
ncbi:MAG: inorganic phosphate transporter [Opitutae bacterium]|nr:inorganic phosphate transporter [Opitutae bacterium]